MVALAVLVLAGNPEIDNFNLAGWVLYSEIVGFDILVDHLCLSMKSLNGIKHLQEDADNA